MKIAFHVDFTKAKIQDLSSLHHLETKLILSTSWLNCSCIFFQIKVSEISIKSNYNYLYIFSGQTCTIFDHIAYIVLSIRSNIIKQALYLWSETVHVGFNLLTQNKGTGTSSNTLKNA